MQKIEILKNQQHKLNKLLNRYASYEKFSASKKDAYEYTRVLNVRVCPYCNIHFTYTVCRELAKAKKMRRHYVCRADLDHFEPKYTPSGKPKALNVSNLIPCCQQCNSRVKLRKEFRLTTHVHPYVDDLDSIVRFSVELVAADYLNVKNFRVLIVPRDRNHLDLGRARRTIEDLKLEVRYQYHKPEILDIFKRAKFYHRRKIEEVVDIVKYPRVDKQIKCSELFANLFLKRTSQINSIPLSKMNNDILDIVS